MYPTIHVTENVLEGSREPCSELDPDVCFLDILDSDRKCLHLTHIEDTDLSFRCVSCQVEGQVRVVVG